MKTKHVRSVHKAIGASALALAIVAAGCVPSLHPLYTEKDIVFDPKLVGTWVGDKDSDESWQFIANEDGKSYRLLLKDEGKPDGSYTAHLVKLGPERFLDLFPDSKPLSDLECGDYYKSHLVPCHTFLRVDDIGTGLVLAAFNPEWLSKLVKSDPQAIAHAWAGESGDRLVLTASTAKLQEFFRKNARAPEAFGEPSHLRKNGPSARQIRSDQKNG